MEVNFFPYTFAVNFMDIFYKMLFYSLLLFFVCLFWWVFFENFEIVSAIHDLPSKCFDI